MTEQRSLDGRTQRAADMDQRLLKFAYEHIRGERELTEEQIAYVREETDKLERSRKRVERKEQKNRQEADS